MSGSRTSLLSYLPSSIRTALQSEYKENGDVGTANYLAVLAKRGDISENLARDLANEYGKDVFNAYVTRDEDEIRSRVWKAQSPDDYV